MKGLARHRATILIMAVVVASVLAVALGRGQAETTTALDPANPRPNGARAVARVLADHGVEVEIVRSAQALADSGPDADTTILVTSIDQLGASTAHRLRDDAADAAVVLVEPGPDVTAGLRVPDGHLVDVPEPVPADCTDPRLGELTLEVTTAVEYPTSQGCFRGEQGFLVGFSTRDVTVLGAGELLRNDRVLDQDNAAAALRLLGQRPRLVWYIPSLSDQAAADGVSLGALVPRWIGPGLFLSALTMIAVMIWRGRRLGPLATEPLPVAVKAIETTESRGRLYRRVGDRRHASLVLRDGARRRLARRLHLPAATAEDVEQLVTAVAAAAGRPPESVRALLDPPSPPRNDRELITLATDLAELDREVRRP